MLFRLLRAFAGRKGLPGQRRRINPVTDQLGVLFLGQADAAFCQYDLSFPQKGMAPAVHIGEHQQLHGAEQIFQRDKRHGTAAFGELLFHRLHRTQHPYPVAIPESVPVLRRVLLNLPHGDYRFPPEQVRIL